MMLSNNVSSSLKPPEKEIINFAFTSQPTFQDRLPVTTNSSTFPGLTNRQIIQIKYLVEKKSTLKKLSKYEKNEESFFHQSV